MNKNFNTRLVKSDFILMAVILIIASSLFIFYKSSQVDAGYVRIRLQEKILYELPLDIDKTLRIDDNKGGFNIVKIQAGKASVYEANCNDLSCVYQKAISKTGQSIICLPHKLVVEVYGNTNKDLDSISN